MKKSEKNLLNAVYEKIEDNTSFEKIAIKSGVKLDVKKKESPLKLLFSRKNLAYALSIVAVIALLIPIGLIFKKENGVKQIVIANLNELAVEYQLNSNFISSGIVVKKQFADGREELCLSDEIEIDSSAFKVGVVGEYPITVTLKKNRKITTQYTVQINNEYLCGIDVELKRSVYFLGEKIGKDDIKVSKLLVNKELVGEDFSGEIGKVQQELAVKKEGKQSEYTIKKPEGFLTEEGVHDLGIVLNGNEQFSFNCTVFVQDLNNLYLDGLYAYTDENLQNGPTFLAFAITQNFITSYYSEVALEGRITKQIVDGQIQITDADNLQKAIYSTVNGTLSFKDDVNNSNFICFKIGVNDFLIRLKGDNFYDNRYYLAKGGKLSKGTVEYLKNTYGGIWKDEQRNEAVDENTIFTKDTSLFVGNKNP